MGVDVSACIIGRFFYEPDYQPPVNTGKMDYQLEEIRKINWKQLGLDEKLSYIKWITTRIALNDENAMWVVGGLGVTSQKIEKHTLNFETKTW